MVSDADEEEAQELARLTASVLPGPPPPAADVFYTPRRRLDKNGKYSSKLAPDHWLTSTMPTRLADAECTTGQPGPLGDVTDDDASAPSASTTSIGTRASLMLGLSVMVSLFDSASSLADVVDDTSTGVYSVGPTGQPGGHNVVAFMARRHHHLGGHSGNPGVHRMVGQICWHAYPSGDCRREYAGAHWNDIPQDPSFAWRIWCT